MMFIKPQTTWRKEATVWAICLAAALLSGTPLIVQCLVKAGAGTGAVMQKGDLPLLQDTTIHSSQPLKTSQDLLGRAYLDLKMLSRDYSMGEADNVRWSLVRRTPSAAQVYSQENGVDWKALRSISQSGTILLPARFSWSFNETFQQGPGYKVAGGILAGGHCSLATVFRAAAMQANLPTEARPHARAIPGFSLEESANIYWGRHDLVVNNNTGLDLYFVWILSLDGVEVSVVPVASYDSLPPLADWPASTIAMVYGRPAPGGWGSLGQTTIADQALYLARTYAMRVDEWNSAKPVVVALNPNAAMDGEVSQRELYLYYLIGEARRQEYYVMLDVQPGEGEPLSLFTSLMDTFLQENVWFDWDLEHTSGGKVDAEQINQVAAAYFAHRKAMGYQNPGLFGFYVFNESQVTNPGGIRRQYDNGVVVPVFDGFGGESPDPSLDKIAKTAGVLSLFGDGPYGIMEFETRWEDRYDQISARDYFAAFPEALIMASQ